jgi:hypothetical protein
MRPLDSAPSSSWSDNRVRWYVLALFLWLTTNQCLCWFTFSTASTPGVSEYYGFSTNNNDQEIDLLLNWGPICGLLMQPFATMMLSHPRGLVRSMRLGAALTLACCAIRLVPSLISPSSASLHPLLHVAQALNAAAGPLLMGACSLMSATWFPPAWRASATAVAYSGGNAGQLLGFAFGPLIVADSSARVETLLVVELVLAAVPALLCAIYLPARPSQPVSVAAAQLGPSSARAWLARLRQALGNRSLVGLALLTGTQAGVVSAWGGLINQAPRPRALRVAPTAPPAPTAIPAQAVARAATLLDGHRRRGGHRQRGRLPHRQLYGRPSDAREPNPRSLPRSGAPHPRCSNRRSPRRHVLPHAPQGLPRAALRRLRGLLRRLLARAPLAPLLLAAAAVARYRRVDRRRRLLPGVAGPRVVRALGRDCAPPGPAVPRHRAAPRRAAPHRRARTQVYAPNGGSEGLSAGLIVLVWNTASLIMLAAAPSSGASATNAAVVAVFVVAAVGVAVFVRESYGRSRAEAAEEATQTLKPASAGDSAAAGGHQQGGRGAHGGPAFLAPRGDRA